MPTPRREDDDQAPGRAVKTAPSLAAQSARSAGVVSIAIMISRVLGLIREMAIAGLFGAGRMTDVFYMAFRIPNLLRDLFAEGALSAAFVTTFSKTIANEGDDAAWQLARRVMTLVLLVMSIVTLLGMIFAPLVVDLLAGGFDEAKEELTVTMTRIMFPFILMISVAALVMGMLNSKKRFFIPALASSFFNLGAIVVGIGLAWLLDPNFGDRALVGLAFGVLAGGFLQLLIQLPSLYGVGFRFRPDFKFRDSKVYKVLELMAPAIIAGSAVQVNVMVNSIFASHLGDGPVTWLQNAFRLLQLPIGVFGVAVMTVTLPQISTDAAREQLSEFRENLSRGIRLAFVLTIPCTIGLAVLSEPIMSLIFERGRFTAEDSAMAGAALQFYVIGLAAYAGIKVLAPAFYALDMKNMPMIVSFISIGVNLVLNWFFTFHLGMGHRGLALSTGLVALSNFGLLYILMWRRLGRFDGTRMLSSLGKVMMAGSALGAICFAGAEFVLKPVEDLNLLARASGMLGVITVAGLAYLVIAWMLRVEELMLFSNQITKKLKD